MNEPIDLERIEQDLEMPSWFLILSREDVAGLVAEIKRLRAEVDRLRPASMWARQDHESQRTNLMGRYYCHDDYEHRRDAERDARRGTPDRDYYDRYADDACKEVYTQAYDEERRRQEYREQVQRDQEEGARRIDRNAEAAREEYYRQCDDDYDRQQAEQDNAPSCQACNGTGEVLSPGDTRDCCPSCEGSGKAT